MSGIVTGKRRSRAAFQPVVMPSLEVEKGSEEFDTRTERAIEDLATAVNALGEVSYYEDDVTLAIGTNTINHGLNRTPTFVWVAPNVAAAAFAWGWDPAQPGNPKPTLLVQVTSATAATVRIRVE